MTAQPTRASFTPLSGPAANRAIAVHFNPESLQIAITNTLEDKGQGREKKQYVTKSSAKLTMDLIFDTTHSGSDVRQHTGQMAKLMEPGEPQRNRGAPPSVVRFEWGSFSFQGLVESYKETLDFFSPNGVPLRASINLTLASQEQVFQSLTQGSERRFEPVVQNLSSSGESLTDVVTRAGNANASRAVASENNQESIRFPDRVISLPDEIPLAPPTAFASGAAAASSGLGGGIGLGASGGPGAGAGFSGGASLGVGGGISGGAGLTASAAGGIGAAFAAGAALTASAGADFSVQGGATLPAIGGRASAGVSASAGAFAGLRTSASATGPPVRLDPARLNAPEEALAVSTDARAGFEVGGRAAIAGSASLRADVGAQASLQDRIQFG